MQQPLLPSRAREYWFAAAIAAVGAGLLVFQWYWTRPLWLDEEMIALNLRDRRVTELAGSLWLNQSAPLGWLVAQRLIVVEFGAGERALRALPVLVGIALLALAFWTGRRWMTPLGAGIFVLLCSFGQVIAFFPLEVKPYSADAFFGLLIPVLGAWAVEPPPDGGAPRLRRVVLWWLTAAIGQWFANGALFATPACAVVLCALTWRRAGWRHAFSVALSGVLWLGSFALHYHLGIRHSFQSDYLRGYWAWALPPAGARIAERLWWVADQLKPLAHNPGGTLLWRTFWLSALGGIAVVTWRSVPAGFMLLALPLSAFLLGGLRLVPLAARVSLWMLPALYAGIAIAADASMAFGWRSLHQRNWLRVAPAVLAAATALSVSWDIVRSGRYELSISPRSNHNLDDRAALRFLMAQRQPGDVFVTTHLGLPAIWWYGLVNVAPPNLGRSYEADGTPIFEAWHESPGPGCIPSKLASPLVNRSRIALYLGFDSNNPPGFQELVLDVLSELGRMTTYRRIAEDGVAAVFDLRQPAAPWTVMVTGLAGQSIVPPIRPRGCVGFRTVSRW